MADAMEAVEGLSDKDASGAGDRSETATGAGQESNTNLPGREIADARRRALSGPLAVRADGTELWSTGETQQLQSAQPEDVAAPVFAACSLLVRNADFSMSVVADGALEVVAASNDRIRALDEYQIDIGEGPMVDVSAFRRAIVNCALSGSGDRWPRYAPLSIGAGYEKVHAFCLAELGVLSVTGRGNRSIGQHAVEQIDAIVNIACVSLRTGSQLSTSRELAGQLQRALDSRVVIEQAKGIVSVWLGMRVDDAFHVLRQLARSRRVHLAELATTIAHHDVDQREFQTLLHDLYRQRDTHAQKGSRTAAR